MTREPLCFTPLPGDPGAKPPPCPCGDNDGLPCSLPGCPYPLLRRAPRTPEDGRTVATPEQGRPITTRED